jgi:3-oxoacyl-[acyl-carrier protein] reductase
MSEAKGARLKDKVAIITGGAEGIGYAYAAGFAAEGAKIVIADVNMEAAESSAETLKKQGTESLAVRVDVSSLEDVEKMARTTAERFGRIDILVNNAAIFSRVSMSRVPFHELDLGEWDRLMAVNLKGPFLCIRAVFPYMRDQGGGKIINIASCVFFIGTANTVHYNASKGGIIGLTRSLARELGEYNINVNAIAPGSTFNEDTMDEAALKMRAGIVVSQRSIKRIQYPEDLVGTAIFLASADSDFVTGQTIVVDGGAIMH